MNGAPERIRTSDPQIRSLVLYPAELRARWRRHIAPVSALQGAFQNEFANRVEKFQSSPGSQMRNSVPSASERISSNTPP